jgi:hypothetical protein
MAQRPTIYISDDVEKALLKVIEDAAKKVA